MSKLTSRECVRSGQTEGAEQCSLRPRVSPYLWAGVLLGIVWSALLIWAAYRYGLRDEKDFKEVSMWIGRGWLVAGVIVATLFGGHWGVKNLLAARIERQADELARARSEGAAPPPAPPYATVGSQAMLAGTGPRYALEIRAATAFVNISSVTGIWGLIQKKRDAHVSVMPQTPEAYGESVDDRAIFDSARSSAEFKRSAGQALDRWPIPVLVMGPPPGPGKESHPAKTIAPSRQDAGLGVAMFTSEWEGNDNSALEGIEQLFAFFDANPDVPEALLTVVDGTELRQWLNTPGLPPVPKGMYVPPVQTTISSLLVSRTDRVDLLMRPFVVSGIGQGITKKNADLDIIKLWSQFWKDTYAYDLEVEKQQKARGDLVINGPGTMPSSWWHQQLPRLWSQTNNRGPGLFQPSNYLPVRWTDWQLKQFDRAPMLGYLHRPVRIPLTREDGKPMRAKEQAASVAAAWQAALQTLPEGQKPVRVFYDTSMRRDWAVPVTQALANMPDAPEPGNVDEDYDIGRRIGDTGTASAMVELALATVAGYREEGASATIHLTDRGYAGIIMVSPPDDQSKAFDQGQRGLGKDPFNMLVPR